MFILAQSIAEVQTLTEALGIGGTVIVGMLGILIFIVAVALFRERGDSAIDKALASISQKQSEDRRRIEDKLDTYKEQSQAKIETLNRELGKAEGMITLLKEQSSSDAQAHARLTEQIDQLKKVTVAQNRQIETLRGRVSELEDANKRKDQRINELETTVSTKNKHINKLEGLVDTLTTDNGQLVAVTEALKEQVRDATTRPIPELQDNTPENIIPIKPKDTE